MRKTLYLVRHGRTRWNAEGRMQGQLDSDLDEVGLAQADQHGRWLNQQGIDAMFVSPLGRTRETAAIISRHVDVPTYFDARLKEWHCGDWSGHLYSEVEQKWPTEWAGWREDQFHRRSPGGENFPDMIARVAPLLDELLALPLETIAIVSHGMIGKAMLATLLGLSPQRTVSFRQPNARIFRVDTDRLGASVCHFDDWQGPHSGLDETELGHEVA